MTRQFTWSQCSYNDKTVHSECSYNDKTVQSQCSYNDKTVHECSYKTSSLGPSVVIMTRQFTWSECSYNDKTVHLVPV